MGKRNGTLATVRPDDLLADTLKALVERAKIDPSEVEDVVIGCVDQLGEQGLNIARNAALIAGFPLDVCGTTLDRMCGSGQQAANFAAMGVMSGQYECVIAGGVESMTPRADGLERHGARRRAAVAAAPGPLQHRAAGHLGRDDRREVGAQARGAGRVLRRRATRRRGGPSPRAASSGRSPRSRCPTGTVFDTDEGVRVPVNREKLAALAPSFKPDGVVTAANSSQISDGAAALLIMSEARAKALGLTPRARIVATALAGVDPTIMLTGPIPATQRVLAKAGLKIDQIDLLRDQRGLRLGGAGVGAGARPGHGAGQRQRRGDRARPSARLLGRALDDHAAPRARAVEEALRPADDVHRLRPGDRAPSSSACSAARRGH